MNKSVLSTIIGVSLLSLVKKGSAGKTKLTDISDKITISVTATYKRPNLNKHYDTYKFYGIEEHLQNVINSFTKTSYLDHFVEVCEDNEEWIKNTILDQVEEGSPSYQMAIPNYEAAKSVAGENPTLDKWVKFYKDIIPEESDVLQEIEEETQEKMFSDLNEIMGVDRWDEEAQGILGRDFDFESELPYPITVTWDKSAALEDVEEDLQEEWEYDNLLNTPLTLHFTFSMADLKERYSDKKLMEIMAWKNNWSSSRHQIEQVIEAILDMAHKANVNQSDDWGRGIKFDDDGGFGEFTYSVSFGKTSPKKYTLRRR